MQWAAIVSLFVSFALFVLLGRVKRKKKIVFALFCAMSLLSILFLFIWGILRNF